MRLPPVGRRGPQAVQEKKDHDDSVKAADVLRQTLEHVNEHVTDDAQGHVPQQQQHQQQEQQGHVQQQQEQQGHVQQQDQQSHVQQDTQNHVQQQQQDPQNHVQQQQQQQGLGQHVSQDQGQGLDSHVHHGMTAINQHVPQQAHVTQPYELDLNPYNQAPNSAKPPVGSEQWHQMRRDNHKEVERRRRETINDGINTLAELIATSEKNKGQILKNAIEFIKQLKEQDDARTQKAAMDKFSLMNQVTETSAQNNRLKIELQRAWREAETWKGKYQELEGKKE
ncbi:uncharacterized protein YALI1_D31672g [Yarrowia lipolytica]|uniref:BHLH domain-containing protein n=1 Tax=Yarrowia lipolytica TaxID=4952 RepID=A0A1D8NG17_YARLL|nr:hypothetical protein YALI1_D31672g [Yarrowia lipolytica]